MSEQKVANLVSGAWLAAADWFYIGIRSGKRLLFTVPFAYVFAEFAQKRDVAAPDVPGAL